MDPVAVDLGVVDLDTVDFEALYLEALNLGVLDLVVVLMVAGESLAKVVALVYARIESLDCFKTVG
jgi:hypothetical protein